MTGQRVRKHISQERLKGQGEAGCAVRVYVICCDVHSQRVGLLTLSSAWQSRWHRRVSGRTYGKKEGARRVEVRKERFKMLGCGGQPQMLDFTVGREVSCLRQGLTRVWHLM